MIFATSIFVPLDENSLIAEAKRTTGLDDFGDDDNWLEGFSVLLKSLAEEAELTLLGRLMARSDILMWLQQRLTVIDTLKKHPEVLDEEIIAPMFIVGMPRSGTSILFELLWQDEDVGVPLRYGKVPIPVRRPKPRPMRLTRVSKKRTSFLPNGAGSRLNSTLCMKCAAIFRLNADC